MSIGPLSFAGTGAATPLAQSKGSDADRAEHESAAQEGKFQNDLKADQAAGIGQTDGEEHEAEERDADGRRLWEIAPKKELASSTTETADAHLPHSRDATGQCGNSIDLTG